MSFTKYLKTFSEINYLNLFNSGLKGVLGFWVVVYHILFSRSIFPVVQEGCAVSLCCVIVWHIWLDPRQAPDHSS